MSEQENSILTLIELLKRNSLLTTTTDDIKNEVSNLFLFNRLTK